MSPLPDSLSNIKRLPREFDELAEKYQEQHKANIAITGESPEYFAEYKIAGLKNLVKKRKLDAKKILDFGSGIGNSIPFFRKYFDGSELICADVSSRSLEISKSLYHGREKYLLIDHEIPLLSNSQDIIFSAGVFHHIPIEEHHYWLRELLRLIRPGGLLVIYEHNPWNPLTVRAVNTCPLDINANLVSAKTMCIQATETGWEEPTVEYTLFFPSPLKILRPIEKHLAWLPLGAQYRMFTHRPTNFT